MSCKSLGWDIDDNLVIIRGNSLVFADYYEENIQLKDVLIEINHKKRVLLIFRK